MAAQKERQFDPMNVYATLVDPRGRAKDVRIVYATDAANNYLELHTRKSVFDLFRTDFEHWDENHFRSLPKKCTARLRGVHMQKQVTIRGGRFPAFRSLSQIMSNRNSVSVSAVRSATQTPVKPVNDGVFKKLEDRMVHLDATVADIEEQNTYHSKPRAPAVKRRKTAAIKIDDVAAVRDAAAVTAQKAHPFNARNIYSTLVNPHGCAKEVLAQFATTVITKYSRQEAPKEVFRLLAEDFKYWQDIHFRSVPKEVTEKLRNVLMRSGSYFAVSHSQHIERCHREFEITTMSPLPPHT